MNAAPLEPVPIRFSELDHGHWLNVQEQLRQALRIRQLERLTAPATVIVNDLLNSAVRTMHRHVFLHTMENEFGLAIDGNDEQLDTLYKVEMSEHGARNIVRACENGNWAIATLFPVPNATGIDVLVRIDVPFMWDQQPCQTSKLIKALGLHLRVSANGDGCYIDLSRQGELAAELPPELLDDTHRLASMEQIFDQLGYGLIHFSAIGEVIAASPSMLARFSLAGRNDWAGALTEAIPLNFYSDIIWGQALAEGDGVFENFRIRLPIPGAGDNSTLFNVSGFRAADATIRSLWQVVSQEEGAGHLTEGSILSGMRIHNITRHYVPQLVEEKARDAVRQGKTALTNEDRQIAVLFCDIVGFTSYVERNVASESIIETLNFILSRVSHSVTRNRGFIDKFMGDCIMAIFDDPADSVLAAIDMQTHSRDMNELRERAGQQTLQLRIGIHWGEVVLCNVGTIERLDWTAIGDVVNIAARIEKGCDPGGILISKGLRDAIESVRPGQFKFGATFGLHAKGKRDELVVCNVEFAAG